MNLQELIKEVNKDNDDSLSNADATQWINRALDDLTPVAKYKKTAAIQLVSGQNQYECPSDIHKIELIIDEQELSEIPLKDRTSRGYKKWGNDLTIQPTPDTSGELTLYYYAKLPHLANSDDVPTIPSYYHDLLVLFTVAKAKYKEEEPEMQLNAWNEYLAKKREFAAEQNQDGEVGQVRLVT
ncbi:hypothetical protein RRV45_15100 [Bacillus sp. DTU_2020_1000418_1_SI_GHA_SEK_038]|uniref:phage adaptor protein n=1 Tax=Bacillus sp. DTU_2020_1000418_1_SI_GHA_SEK_038 TaxID=3077585 RepID=UPI0028E73F7C|nr:hypothetical protein [Bacillus sp. DTU_2020_1000418_1_SI_GHA_SEK_038]WNS74236.1 hypothetical protein RRV45_15100 [Bacillus sp. DTU_2020_1000418_1_SI_GHA_SEK_038]